LRRIFAVYLIDGVVKSLHPESRRLAYLARCYNFSIITTYRMYAEIIEKLHASNMKLFYLSIEIEVSYESILQNRFLRRHVN